MAEQRGGRNYKAVAADIAEGFVYINPIYLKPFDEENLKHLNEAIQRKQNEVRALPFPFGKIDLIRQRNMRLQRLHTSLMMIRNFARERRIRLV
jgi:hypothetical protein